MPTSLHPVPKDQQNEAVNLGTQGPGEVSTPPEKGHQTMKLACKNFNYIINVVMNRNILTIHMVPEAACWVSY